MGAELRDDARAQREQLRRTTLDATAVLDQALIDREKAVTAAELARHGLREALDAARDGRRDAAVDRRASHQDRRDAAGDREASSSDRDAAAADRAQAEVDAQLSRNGGSTSPLKPAPAPLDGWSSDPWLRALTVLTGRANRWD